MYSCLSMKVKLSSTCVSLLHCTYCTVISYLSSLRMLLPTPNQATSSCCDALLRDGQIVPQGMTKEGQADMIFADSMIFLNLPEPLDVMKVMRMHLAQNTCFTAPIVSWNLGMNDFQSHICRAFSSWVPKICADWRGFNLHIVFLGTYSPYLSIVPLLLFHQPCVQVQGTPPQPAPHQLRSSHHVCK